MSHHAVVHVCVDSQVAFPFEYPVEDEFCRSLHSPRRGDAVEDGVFSVMRPASFYTVVCLFFPYVEDEYGKKSIVVVKKSVEPPRIDIIFYDLQGGVVISPLVGVAVLAHESSCLTIDCVYFLYFFSLCFSYSHNEMTSL